jgi:hypothetical protein
MLDELVTVLVGGGDYLFRMILPNWRPHYGRLVVIDKDSDICARINGLGETLRIYAGSPAAEKPLEAVHCPDSKSLTDYVGKSKGPKRAIVATPPATHLEIAKVLDGHVDEIYVEKPLADTPEDAQQFVKRRWKSLVRGLDHYLFKSTHVQLAEGLGEGFDLAQVGRVVAISFERRPLWNAETFRKGYWIEHGVHLIQSLDKIFQGTLDWDKATEMQQSRWLHEGLDPGRVADSGRRVQLRVPRRHRDQKHTELEVDLCVGKGMEQDKKVIELQLDRRRCIADRFGTNELLYVDSQAKRRPAPVEAGDPYGYILAALAAGYGRCVSLSLDRAAMPLSIARPPRGRRPPERHPVGQNPGPANEVLARLRTG